jgi:hypothetical protein
MIDLTYKITGVDAIIRQLEGIRLDALNGDVASLLDDIAADAADYPPPVGTYVRSGDLGHGWTESEPLMQGDADSLLAVLTNSVSYGPFVQGTEDQAKVHAGRWKTTDQIADAWEDRAAQRIEAAIGRLIGI